VREDADGALRQLAHRQIGTRLGEDLHDGGSLGTGAMNRTLEAVEAFVAIAHEYDAALACIATSAMRRAANAGAFAARLAAVTGVDLEIVSGTREAVASYRGATLGIAGEARTAVLDIGGGSTECALGSGGALGEVRSLEIGSVRVAERFPALLGGSPGAAARSAAVAARAYVRDVLAPLGDFVPVAQVRCVAGTPLTIGAIVRRSDVDRVSGSWLARADVDATVERLLDLDLAARRNVPGMLAQRADIIVAGALVLSEALAALGAEAGLLEANDLLLGYLVETAGRASPAK